MVFPLAQALVCRCAERAKTTRVFKQSSAFHSHEQGKTGGRGARQGWPPPEPREGQEVTWLATRGVKRCRAAFEHARPFTVGAEEELMLVDPVSFDLAPVIEDVLPLVSGDGRF